MECGTQLELLEGHSKLVMILFTSKGNCALRVQTQSHKTMKVIAITFCNERPPTGTNLHLPQSLQFPQSLQLPLSLHHFYATLAATTCANTNHSTENGKRAVDDEEGLGPVSQLAQKGNNLLRVKKHPPLKSSSSASSSSSEKIVTLISSSNYHPDKM